MQKIFTKILISVFMVGIFLLPIVGQINVKNTQLSLNLKIQTVEAGHEAGHEDQGFIDATIEGAKDVGVWLWENNGVVKTYKLLKGDEFGCSVNPATWFTNCIGMFLYKIIFEPLTLVMAAAGQLLDFFLFYSTSSQAYSSDFIGQAWGAVRDISNIFFIIALLFVAIKTVLSFNVSNNKKVIGYIIIMALLINFSLFATQVIVDASNILARIFYNEITAIDKNGEPIESGENKEKSISAALVSIYEPQRILNETVGEVEDNPGSFILITLLVIMLLGVTIYVFLSVSFLFVARVIGLWFHMILSPIAFASKTVSFNIPGLGFQEWLENLFKYAFMAPIFIFFLYIIALMADSLGSLTAFSSSSDDIWLTKFMNVIIPFIFIMFLLLKAKKLATIYSGEAGKAVNGVVKLAGGLVGGAALGAVAFGGTKLIGGVASRVASSETLKAKAEQGGLGGYMARMQLKAANYGSKASFDVRKTVAGKELSKVSGMNFQSSKVIGLGSKEGGFKGMVDRKYEKIQKESELYKTTMSDTEVKKWSDDRVAKHYEDREEARKKGVTYQEYDAKHAKPKTYRNAAELNNDKLKAYQEKIGRSGLIGSLIYSKIDKVNNTNYKDNAKYKQAHEEKAYAAFRKEKFDAHIASGVDEPFKEEEVRAEFKTSYASKELNYDAEIANKINDDKAKSIRNKVGASLGAAIGGVVGGTLAGPMGVAAGGMVGAGLGLENQLSVTAQAAKKFGGTLKKEAERLKNIDDRIDDLSKVKKEHEDVLKEGLSMNNIDLQGTKVSLKDKDGKLNKDVLEQVISDRAMDTERDKEELKDLAKKVTALKGDDYEEGKDIVLDGSIRTLENQIVNTKKAITDRALEVKKYNSIKDAEGKIRDTDNQISNLKGNRTPPSAK